MHQTHAHAPRQIFGTEVAVGQRISLSGEKVAVFTWTGATVQIEGAPEVVYASSETLMVPYANTHEALEARRRAGASCAHSAVVVARSYARTRLTDARARASPPRASRCAPCAPLPTRSAHGRSRRRPWWCWGAAAGPAHNYRGPNRRGKVDSVPCAAQLRRSPGLAADAA